MSNVFNAIIKDKEFYLEDLETGHLYSVSKEIYESYHAMVKNMHEDLKKSGVKGSVIIFGAYEDGHAIDSFKKLWTESKESKTIDIK